MWLSKSLTSRNHHCHFVSYNQPNFTSKWLNIFIAVLIFYYCYSDKTHLAALDNIYRFLTSVVQSVGPVGSSALGFTKMESKHHPAGFLPRGSLGEYAPQIMQVTGKIQFLAVVGLRPHFLTDCQIETSLSSSKTPLPILLSDLLSEPATECQILFCSESLWDSFWCYLCSASFFQQKTSLLLRAHVSRLSPLQ